MAHVPTYDGFQVAPGSMPGARFDAQVMPDVAGKKTQQIGEGMQKMGGDMMKIALDMQDRQDKAEAKDQDVSFTQKLNDLQFHPEAGYLNLQGKNAVEAYPKAVDSIKQMRQETLSGIQNQRVRELVDSAITDRSMAAISSMSRHAAKERTEWQLQSSNDRALTTLQDAASNYDNPKAFELSLGTALNEAKAQGELRGWDDATTRLQMAKYTDLAYKMRYESWRIKDPVGAFANFQENAERISPLAREQIGTHLFSAAAPVLAQQLNQAGGIGVVASTAPGSGTASSPSSPDSNGPLPRGIRNNNPGNIAKGPSAWQDEVQGNDPKYVSFATPEAGIRAMGKTLINYQDKYGLNTVEGIISRWAPASDNNDVPAYANTVAKALGVKANAPIDLHDTGTLTKITRAMIQVENGPGASRITDQQLALGLAAANGGAPLAASTAPSVPRDPAAPTGYPMLDALPADWKLHVLQLARAQAHQDMAVARESLRGKVQDAMAEYMATGMASKPPSEAEFIRAYGQAEGIGHYRDFQNVAVLGQTLQQVKTLPASALVSMLQSSKPTPGEGFAARQHNYEILARAVEQVQQARTEDPVAYALTSKSYGIQPFQRLDNPAALSGELARRAAAAPQMAADYGTAPQLLTKGEAKALSANLSAAPVEAQKQQLATIFQGVRDMGLFKQTMQAIAPDNPTAAVAGIYQARGLRTTDSRDVADLILRGQAILTPNAKSDGSDHQGGKALIKMPEEKLLLSDWNSITGDAFKGKEQASDLFQQTAKAIYAAKSAEAGDYSGVIDSKRWKQSINLATGGIESHNGVKVVLPYGYGYDRFQNELKVQAERIVKDGGALNTTASEMMRLPVESIGDGRYMFRRGAGYLVSKDGRPVIADLSGGR